VFKINYRSLYFDILGLSGTMSLFYGLFQIYKPSAFVVTGCLFIVMAILGNRAK